MGKHFDLMEYGTRYLMSRIWTPEFGEVRSLVLNEAHESKHCVHLGSDKMYLYLKKLYWWPNMKAEIAIHVGKCLT